MVEYWEEGNMGVDGKKEVRPGKSRKRKMKERTTKMEEKKESAE